MSFNADLFRAMPPEQYGDWMTCPITGLAIPKTVAGNLAWRKSLVQAANGSASVRRALRSACSSSPIYWINAFAWTFLQKKVDADGRAIAVKGSQSHIPFITWKVQDSALLELTTAIDKGYDALIHKSRDMGASWEIVALFQWYFQFRPSTTFLEISRKEVLVDRRGDMDSLFEKHRYLMARQPEWLRPQKMKDNLMFLENLDIGTQIVGESTNENAGQASRKTAILLDEFARIRDGEGIDLATADTSACRIFNSTPQGPNTHFSRIYRAMSTGRRAGKLIIFPWWMHPEKGRDAHIEVIEGQEKVVSPWYREEEKRRSNRSMAQNIEGEHGKSGDMFFDPDEIEKHRRDFVRDPMMVGAIASTIEDITDEQREAVVRKFNPLPLVFLERGARNPWRLWIPLKDGRPSQGTQYVFGVDIAGGTGASNSVITVLDHSTNQIVAKFWDAFTSPEELAWEVALAAVWFGGVRPPLVVFEKNGPGTIFGKKLVHGIKYPNIYYQEIVDQKGQGKTRKWGWHSNGAKKEILLAAYRDALKTMQIINPCEEALSEAADYVYDDKGKLEPGTLGTEEDGGSALHGDHVIADALVVIGRKDLPKEIQFTRPSPKYNSFATRQAVRRNPADEAWAG